MSSQKFVIHQFHHSTSPMDAVTNQMFFLQKSFLEGGIYGEIFSKQIHPALVNRVKGPSNHKLWDCDLLLLHHSTGNPSLKGLLALEVPKAIVYHNITPSCWYAHDPYMMELIQLGRDQLHDMKSEVVATFGDSQYNLRELEMIGFPKGRVLPLYDLSLPRVGEKGSKTRHRKGGLKLVFVGKLTYHKDQAFLIKTLYYLRRCLNLDVRLALVGGQDPVYGFYLRRLVRVLGLIESVEFAGKVSEKELELFYETSDAFVGASRHEGYCIPLVEALRSRLPVFARNIDGVRETLAGAGILYSTDKPHELAEILATFLASPPALQAIHESQAARIRDLKETQSPERARSICLEVLRRLRSKTQEKRIEIHPSIPHLRRGQSRITVENHY